MRIGLFVDAYKPWVSGVVVSVDTLRKELEKKGHVVYIITLEQEGALKDDHVIRFKGMGLPMKGLKEFKLTYADRLKCKKIKQLKLDIIHCHTEFSMGVLGKKVAKKLKLPLVHTYHTMYQDYAHFVSKALAKPISFLSVKFSTNFASNADEVIFPTLKVKKMFDEYGFNKHSNIIPSGIYLDKFDQELDQSKLEILKKQYHITEDDFVCLYLGRLSKEKSIDVLIKQFSKICDVNTKLLIVGKGPDEEFFKKIVKELDLEQNIIFTGIVPPTEVQYYYKISHLFLNFSITETQGLTFIEALASGVPVLARYDFNLDGVIDNYYNGLTFNEDDEFEASYYDLLSDKERFEQIKSNTKQSVLKFSAKQYGDSVEALYKEAIKNKKKS